MTPADIDRVFGLGRLKMVTGQHVEVYREEALPGERRRYTKRFLSTMDGDFREWTEREWRILARLFGHGVACVPEVVQFDRGAGGGTALVQTYDAGVTVDQWATLLPVEREGRPLAHVFEDCAHWWALAHHCLLALDAIHRLEVIHLDIKADNVCIPFGPPHFRPDAPGARLQPLFDRLTMIDFAFSLVAGEALATPLPIGRQLDYPYQSPRLLAALEAGHRGNLEPTRHLDWRCDLYSLAAMLERYRVGTAAQGSWSTAHQAAADTLLAGIRHFHDIDPPAVRPHAELMAISGKVLRDPALASSLENVWELSRDVAPAAVGSSPTPVTKIAPALRGGVAAAVLGDASAPPTPAAAEAPEALAASVAAIGPPSAGTRPRPTGRTPIRSIARAVQPVEATAPSATDFPAVGPLPGAGAVGGADIPATVGVAGAGAAVSAGIGGPAHAHSTATASQPLAGLSADEQPTTLHGATTFAPAALDATAVQAATPSPHLDVPLTAEPFAPWGTVPPRPAGKTAGWRRLAVPGGIVAALAVVGVLAVNGPRKPAPPAEPPLATDRPAVVATAPRPVPAPTANEAPASEVQTAAPVASDFSERSLQLLAGPIPEVAQRTQGALEPALALADTAQLASSDAAVRQAVATAQLPALDARFARNRAPEDARRLNDQARNAFWTRRSVREAFQLQLRAFGANPQDPEIAGNLAYFHLKVDPPQPETARQLALHALAMRGPNFPMGRWEDWTTLAVASAMTGRDADARRAFWLTLSLSDNPEKNCRAALNAAASYGARVRPPAEAVLARVNARGQSNSSRYCTWPPNWGAGTRFP